ncbi:MAG: hypothetical protein IH989_02385 [Planctomycetes bacterium]|nr:hypothetical protein [Planctomycetota bacterium]
MPKSDTIEAILSLNPTAKPDFLAEFSNEDLHDYLHRLTFSPSRIHGADKDEPSALRRSSKSRAAFQPISGGPRES